LAILHHTSDLRAHGWHLRASVGCRRECCDERC
jgi:hypothetical protein